MAQKPRSQKTQPKTQSKTEPKIDEKYLIELGKKYLERRRKRKRSPRHYYLVKRVTIETKTGQKVDAFLILGTTTARNPKAVARQIRSSALQINAKPGDKIYLISRLSELPSLAFQPYKRPRQ